MNRQTHQQSEPLTFEKVWLMIQESQKSIHEGFLETRQMFQKTDKKWQETDKKFNKLENLFTGQWGKLIEALVEPSALSLFQGRGIKITVSSRRLVIEDDRRKVLAEFDILLKNGDEIVLIEVKTTCKPGDVDYFIKKIPFAKKHFPGHKIYGAVAALIYEGMSDKYAYRKGLFVLKAGKEGMVSMLNDKKFKPKVF